MKDCNSHCVCCIVQTFFHSSDLERRVYRPFRLFSNQERSTAREIRSRFVDKVDEEPSTSHTTGIKESTAKKGNSADSRQVDDVYSDDTDEESDPSASFTKTKHTNIEDKSNFQGSQNYENFSRKK